MTGPACACCGDSLVGSDSGSGAESKDLCRACRLAPPPFRRAIAYGLYDGRLRDLVHALKYQGLRPIAHELGGRLAQAIRQLGQDAPREMLVVAVPLHRAKYAERGFNQARLLAAGAVKALHAVDLDWKLTFSPRALVRVRATSSQAGLTPRQRRINLRRAFAVPDPAEVAGRHVLIVDDILTTGATARAVARALVDAGAASVWVATLARARRITAQRFGQFASSDDEKVPQVVPAGSTAVQLQSQGMFTSQDQPSL